MWKHGKLSEELAQMGERTRPPRGNPIHSLSPSAVMDLSAGSHALAWLHPGQSEIPPVMNEIPGQRSEIPRRIPHGTNKILHCQIPLRGGRMEPEARIPDPRAEEERGPLAYPRQQVGGSSSSGLNHSRMPLKGIDITYRLCVRRTMQGHTYFEVEDTPREVAMNVRNPNTAEWVERQKEYEMELCHEVERDPFKLTCEQVSGA